EWKKIQIICLCLRNNFGKICIDKKGLNQKDKKNFVNQIVLLLLQLPLILYLLNKVNYACSYLPSVKSIFSISIAILTRFQTYKRPMYFNQRRTYRSTSTASHVASKLTSTRTTNKGRNKLKVNLQNDNLLSKDYLLLKKVPSCKFCVAKTFQYESPCFCCDNGSIRLTSHNMPTELRNLFLADSKKSQHFRTYSRAYNNMFVFTSLGVHYDRELAKRNCGIYTFRVQGQMYHFIDDLIPSIEKAKKFTIIFL
ncbi:hypothetical protein H5410_034032, partial [Solanum commersonii]